MLVENFADRLKKAISKKGIKPGEIVRISENLYRNGKINKPLTKPLLSHYLKGTYEAKQDNVYTLSLILNVDEAWLMGYDVPMEKEEYITAEEWTNESKYKKTIHSDGSVSYSIIPKIPILGTVKAGYNWLAEENVIGYITDEGTIKSYKKNINEYFALQVIGDSMLPLLSEGDLVIVHDQDDVESGQTAIVLINGEEATIKKVIKTNEGIELHAMNPYYPIKKFTFEDMKKIPVKIIGRVKEAKIKGAFE